MKSRKLLIGASAVILAPGLCSAEAAGTGGSATPSGPAGASPRVEGSPQDRPLYVEACSVPEGQGPAQSGQGPSGSEKVLQKSVVRSLEVDRLRGPAESADGQGDEALTPGRRQAFVENIWAPLIDHLSIEVGEPLTERAGDDRYTLSVPVEAEIPESVIDRVGMWADAQPDLATYSWNSLDGKPYGALRTYDGSPGGDDTVEIRGRTPATEALFRGAYLVLRLQAGDRAVQARPYQRGGDHDAFTVDKRLVLSLSGFSKGELDQLDRLEVTACLALPEGDGARAAE